MPTYTDSGIVLRRVDYGEADRVLTVLTRHHGKIGVMARGVRKAGSRLAPATDLYVHSHMQLARGRGGLEVITQAQPVPGARRLTGDVRRMACAAVCAELADRVLEGDHPLDEGLFELVAEALDDCASPERDPRAAVVWLARRMIDVLGFAPELHVCASCGERLGERATAFSAMAGGLVCAGCARADPGAVECSVRAIKVLRVAAAGDAATYRRLRVDGATLSELEAVIERELAQHLDRQLRSLAVLRSIRSTGA